MKESPIFPKDAGKEEQKQERKQFVITKKIAKHGSQSIIVIPRMLESQLKPGTITQLTIDILENPEKEDENGN
jgi:hypothetical protein